MSMQLGMYIDQNRCTGCFACVVACKDWNDVPAGPASWMRLKTIEKGTYPDLFVAFLPLACCHCEHPDCVSACPVEAITKRDANGIVVVDRDACLGRDDCGACLEACPYDAPQFGAEAGAKMQKCDLCAGRWAEGKKPVCVSSCPVHALDAGPVGELRAKYGDVREAEGFQYASSLGPAVVFKPKRDEAHRAVRRIETVPKP